MPETFFIPPTESETYDKTIKKLIFDYTASTYDELIGKSEKCCWKFTKDTLSTVRISLKTCLKTFI